MTTRFFLVLFFAFVSSRLRAQSLDYPYPVHYIQLTIEEQTVRMAYMDVMPEKFNGKTVMLFHGKNFNGYYWKDVIAFLTKNGFRVVVPDQVGWGRSDKPNIHYSFHLLSAKTKKLLDTLGIAKVDLIAHSMGGMLAVRFALMYPQTIDRLVFENPIGLEDYKRFVPYRSVDELFQNELKSDFASLKKYQQSYFPEWKSEYDQYVRAQWEAMQIPQFREAAWASALTYQMIYEQPVVYEFNQISKQTLIIIGQADRTIVGKNLLSKEEVAKHGQYPELGKEFHRQLKNSVLVPFEGVGHIPHIQEPAKFEQTVLSFLNH